MLGGREVLHFSRPGFFSCARLHALLLAASPAAGVAFCATSKNAAPDETHENLFALMFPKAFGLRYLNLPRITLFTKFSHANAPSHPVLCFIELFFHAASLRAVHMLPTLLMGICVSALELHYCFRPLPPSRVDFMHAGCSALHRTCLRSCGYALWLLNGIYVS